MKLISCLFLLLILGWSNCFGQLNKGTILLGGNIGYSQNAVSDEDLKSSYGNGDDEKKFSAGPRVGLFLKKNLAVGILFNYEHSKHRWWDNYNNLFENSQNQVLSFGPFARYYHFIRQEVAIFGQTSITYNYDYNLEDFYELSVNATPGLAYFITSKIALEMNLGGITYTRGVYKPDEEYKATVNSIDLSFMNGAQIGASFYLSR